MARASRIYSVTEAGEVIGAFTVKHELISYLTRRVWDGEGLVGLFVTMTGDCDPKRAAKPPAKTPALIYLGANS